jgi:hypothetical protein
MLQKKKKFFYLRKTNEQTKKLNLFYIYLIKSFINRRELNKRERERENKGKMQQTYTNI